MERFALTLGNSISRLQRADEPSLTIGLLPTAYCLPPAVLFLARFPNLNYFWFGFRLADFTNDVAIGSCRRYGMW